MKDLREAPTDQNSVDQVYRRSLSPSLSQTKSMFSYDFVRFVRFLFGFVRPLECISLEGIENRKELRPTGSQTGMYIDQG